MRTRNTRHWEKIKEGRHNANHLKGRYKSISMNYSLKKWTNWRNHIDLKVLSHSNNTETLETPRLQNAASDLQESFAEPSAATNDPQLLDNPDGYPYSKSHQD